jgi:hypothetical protein
MPTDEKMLLAAMQHLVENSPQNNFKTPQIN